MAAALRYLTKLQFYTIPDLCACGCGETIWNRGQQYVLGHGTKNKPSLRKGIKVSTITKERLSASCKGRVPWNKGIPATTKRKLNMSRALMGHVSAMKGKTGALCPNWRGGISFLPYCEKFNQKLKQIIRKRDNHVCQLCNIKEENLISRAKHLSVHHVHYDKENCYPDLITLCPNCNSVVNFNRKHYESLFMNKLNDRGLLFWTLSLYKEKTI